MVVPNSRSKNRFISIQIPLCPEIQNTALIGYSFTKYKWSHNTVVFIQTKDLNSSLTQLFVKTYSPLTHTVP